MNLNRLLNLFGQILSPLCRLNDGKVTKCLDLIYTGIYSRQFKAFGNKSIIKRKIDCLLGAKYISIGENTQIGKRLVLTAWKKSFNSPEISIGNNTQIGDDVHISAIKSIKIGSNVLMGKKVTITDNSHGLTTYDSLCESPLVRECVSKGIVVIGDFVWIGDKATILPNVKIGNNSIIGANSVVTKDVPPFSIVGGNPAIIIRHIYNE